MVELSKPTTWELLIKTIIWNIWIAKNNHIFKLKISSCVCVIGKINHLFLFWMFVAPTDKRLKMEHLDQAIIIIIIKHQVLKAFHTWQAWLWYLGFTLDRSHVVHDIILYLGWRAPPCRDSLLLLFRLDGYFPSICSIFFFISVVYFHTHWTLVSVSVMIMYCLFLF